MDLCDISKLTSRKRVNSDAEKLREKVSRETSKIIKLKVAQDTAYWDLKEKLQTVEANHERLQRNMVEVQMQQEAISSKYHDELRLRPETLNKLASTREICDALQEYTERVRGSLRRAQADRDELSRAYTAAAARAHDAHLLAAAAAAADHRSLAAELRATREAAAGRAAERAAAAEAETRSLRAALADQRARTAAALADLAQRDQRIKENDREIARLTTALAEQKKRETEAAIQLRNEAKRRTVEAQAAGEALAAAESRIGTLTAEMEKQRHEAAAEMEKQRLEAAAEMEKQRLEVAAEMEKHRLEAAASEAARAQMQREIDRLHQLLQVQQETIEKGEFRGAEQSAEIETLRSRIDTEALILRETEAARDAATIQAEEARLLAAEKDAALASMEERSASLAAELHATREEAARTARELASRADTISQLMRDVAAEAEGRARSDAALAAARADLDAAAQRTRDADERGRRDAELMRTMETKLAEHQKIILDLRTEKEQLQKTNSDLQHTIENVQWEVMARREGRLTEPAGKFDPPEHDDNALAAPPSPHRSSTPAPPSPRRSSPAAPPLRRSAPAPASLRRPDPAPLSPRRSGPAAPPLRRSAPAPPSPRPRRSDLAPLSPRLRAPAPSASRRPLDPLDYNFLSDSSTEGDSVDPILIKRRFEALSRGEVLSPVPLSALLRRRAGGQSTSTRRFFKNKRPGSKAKKSK